MPRRPRSQSTRRTSPSPFDEFFDGIIDTVLDQVESDLAPVIEDLSTRVAKTVRDQIKKQAQAQTQDMPYSTYDQRPRTSQGRGRTQSPPPPPPPRPGPSQPLTRHTLYDELEVSTKASQETIAAAYRALAKKFHVDGAGKGQPWAEERMRRVNAAWEVLGDKGKKLEYDRKLNR